MAAAKVFACPFVFVALFTMVASDPDLLQDLCVANKAAGKTTTTLIYILTVFLTWELILTLPNKAGTMPQKLENSIFYPLKRMKL